MPEFVKKLKDKREQLGITLEQAENDTKIRKDYLKSIETGNFEQIKQETHIRGFLKVYSNYLGLDQEEILADYKSFKKELEGEVEEEITFKEKLVDRMDKNQNILLIFTIVISGILAVGVLGFVGNRVYHLIDNPETFNFQPLQRIQQVVGDIEEEVDEELEEEVEQDLGDDLVDELEEPEETITELEGEEEYIEQENMEEEGIEEEREFSQTEELDLKIETIEDTWYLVIVDGEEVFEGSTVTGEVNSFLGSEIEIRIGNAAGVIVIKNGEEYGPFGEEGEVITQTFSVTEDEEE
ncbi:DUF4115 domain-containing protein [Natroniella sulfidigena]|uniref:helix-turn-helix domain-containing protein n=1 Tax=Natroniella sulfidigena TaxID=723921 RepID=UPI00200AF092|nr:helix-turn-helix domain-containing protein [Natroniella sulfidigena]MCK8817994.1 DUF4115 domain-containing protein [Natroniella sulfidigena]